MRIIVVCPDDGLSENVSHTLQATGATVDTFRSLGTLGPDDFDAAFYVIKFTELLASSGGLDYIARLTATARVVILLGRGSLASLVDIMRASDRVVGMFVAEAIDHVALLSLAQRVLASDRLGIDKLMPSAEIQSHEVGYANRKACGYAVSKYLVKRGVSRKHQIQIEQCLDEMLMNALYDAPVDDAGNPVFGNVTARTRVTLRLATTITVQYAVEGNRAAISVRDNFGSLTRQTVLRVLHKCLHQRDKIDRKAGGAGVGLYLMVNASTAVYFNVCPGVETEAVCTFDLASTEESFEQFAFTEVVDPTISRAPLTAADLVPTPIRGPLGWRHAATLALVLAAGVAVTMAVRRSGSSSAPMRPAIVAIASVPSNANVEVNGRLLGHTPLELSTLEPGARFDGVLRLVGYRDAKVQLQVPARGERLMHVEQLTASDEFVTVRIHSEPPGARILQLGATTGAARTYTPAELQLKADTQHSLALVMPGYAPLVLEAFMLEPGAHNVEKRGRLEPGFTVRFTSKTGGLIEVTGDPICRELAVPAECTLASGRHTVSFVADNGAPITKQLDVTSEELTVELP